MNPNPRRDSARDQAAADDLAGSGRLLTVADLARYLQIHEKTIYDWTARGELPCVRIGNRVRFRAADVVRWVEARKEG